VLSGAAGFRFFMAGATVKSELRVANRKTRGQYGVACLSGPLAELSPGCQPAVTVSRDLLPHPFPAMNKLCTFGGATIGSYVGWFLGMRFGYFAAFAVSGVASLVGVYAGWKLAQRLR